MIGKFEIYVLKYKEYNKQKEQNNRGKVLSEIC